MTTQVTTGNIVDQAVTAAKIADAAITKAKMAALSVGAAQLEAGAVVQVVNTQTGAVATGTTSIPYDDTIPQNTEGTEFMTLAITPVSDTNKLRIDVVVNAAHSTAGTSLIAALFQDSGANALACASVVVPTGDHRMQIRFTHYMTAGTTSATTFRVRVGGNVGATTTFNGASGTRAFGGVLASSITITEIKA